MVDRPAQTPVKWTDGQLLDWLYGVAKDDGTSDAAFREAAKVELAEHLGVKEDT